VRRLTGGFKRDRAPRFLPSGRIVFAWSEGKKSGIDTIDGEGRTRLTLDEGVRSYRTLAPSPDGRFLAATLAWDMGFHPLRALFGAGREDLRLLDASGRERAILESSARHSYHSADWSR
jgi:hypothetical protein